MKVLASLARENGHRSVGLSDHGTFAGAIQFIKACREQDVRPVVGIETYLCRNMYGKSVEEQPDKRRGNRHLNLFAKNYEGYQNLCTLSQRASVDGYYYDPRIDIKLLSEYSSGLICSTACLSNVINHNLLIDKYDDAKKGATILKDIFKDDFYLEIMFHGINDEAKIIPGIQKLSKDLDIKIIATNDCFVPGTFVSTPSGCSCIELLNVGDTVYSHTGKKRKVEYVNTRKISEEILDIKTNNGSINIRCTLNHPFYTVKNNIGNGFLKVGDPEWALAKDLKPGYFLCTPKVELKTSDRNDFDLLYDLSSLKERWYVSERNGNLISCRTDKIAEVPVKIKMDRHFYQVLGLYLAEGCIDGTVINFGFHSKEKILIDIISSFFERYNFHPTIVEKDNSTTVRVNSFVFSFLLNELCGHGAKTKYFPDVEKMTKNEIITVLRYYFEGDGNVNKNGKVFMIGSTSSSLIWRISQILQIFNIYVFPTIRNGENASKKHKNAKSIWNDLYILNFAGENLEKLNKIMGLEFSGYEIQRAIGFKSKYLVRENYILTRIKSITKTNYTGNVINLQIGEDESFIVNSVASHNCHYAKKDDAKYHEAVLAISSNKCLKDPSRIHFPYDEFYYKSTEEMYKIFGSIPKSLKNTVELAEKCDLSDFRFGGMNLPKFDIPGEFTDPFEYLKKIAFEGLAERGLDKKQEYVDRLNLELSDTKLVFDTKKYGFATYFLIVEDIIKFAHNKKIPIDTRGSGNASLLLYSLKISNVDPLRHSLSWNRFLGFDSMAFFMDSDFGVKTQKN